MVKNKKIIVVLPAYNASKTLKLTVSEIPKSIVDEIILVDDNSTDETVEVAKSLGIKHILIHERNLGYGANQKTCYEFALRLNADIIIMLHPDYQYTPLIIEALIYPIVNGVYDVMIASRILGNGAIKGGMPIYKYVSNRFLTLFQNLALNQKLSEYHTGYRAYDSNVLKNIYYKKNSNNFIFDNQLISQIFYKDFSIGEVSCPTKYFPEASSINLYNSIIYGLGVIKISILYRLNKLKVLNSELFN